MPGSSMAFDSSSGQVFREWTVSGQPSDGQVGWYAERTKPLRPGATRGRHGPHSLVEMAVTSVVKNIDLLPAEYFEQFATHVLRLVWDRIEPGGATLRDWKIFSKLLLDEGGKNEIGLYRFRQLIPRPEEELTCYTQHMSSTSLDFITHLIIGHGCDFGGNELLRLAEMPNLGVLEFQATNEPSPVSDRLIRGWAEVKNCFPVLRLLRIHGRNDVTQESLGWVSKFPSLIMYDVLSERKKWLNDRALAANNGWYIGDNSITSDRSQDWLLRYMAMLSPLERSPESSRECTKPADVHLHMVLSALGRPLTFVPTGKAPSLMAYLTDKSTLTHDTKYLMLNVKNEQSLFESWGFWLFALAGQLIQDKDLEGYSTTPGMQAVKGRCVLPSRPFATLMLGDRDRNQSRWNYPLTFVRRSIRDSTRGGQDKERVESESRQRTPHDESRKRSQAGLEIPKSKRQRLGDMMRAYSGS